jgi:sugar phosphate isomerase/epimerase
MTSHPSRRRFLRTAGAALGLAAVPAVLRAEKKKDGPFGGFILGCQSYTFRKFNTEQALKRIKDLGLHYVELYQKHAPLEATAEQNKALLKLCKEYDITPVCWGVQGFSKDHDKNKTIFEFAKALGLKAISADPDPDSFDSLDKLCDEYKIAIAIHPHGPQGDKLHRWYSAEKIMEAVKDHNELIGSCLDTGHLIRCAQLGEKLDPAKEVIRMGKRNFGLHLKDHDNKRKTDVVFGKDGGVLDMVALLRALREVYFRGHLSIEYEAKEEEPTEDVAACVDVFKASVKKLP